MAFDSQLLPQLGLMFFASDDTASPDNKYGTVLQASRLADDLGFHAVWFPERHFHRFGGLFPNPAVLAAAVATQTSRLRIRAGSVVLPLHDPIRVAEEWSMIDNLSQGRVDIAFATGWDADSFVLSPDRFDRRLEETLALTKIVETLWRGNSIERRDGNGLATAISIRPAPVQPTLPIWITAAHRTELFERAGAAGHNILTALLFQPVDELATKIGIYRKARQAAGYDPHRGVVSLMLHTFVAADGLSARRIVRQPMLHYLTSSVDLWSRESQRLASLNERDRNDVLELAFERYVRTSALIGDPSTCRDMLQKLRAIGVNDVACLIDFGLADDDIASSLHRLATLI